MDIFVTIRKLDDKDGLRTFAEEKLRTALARFDERIREVAIRLEDLSGPTHKGADKRCRIDVQMKPAGQVLIDEVGDEIRPAIALAVDRLKAAIGREAGRRKRGVGQG